MAVREITKNLVTEIWKQTERFQWLPGEPIEFMIFR